MKKIIFFTLCLFAAYTASAQRYYGPRRRPPYRTERHERQRHQDDDFYRVKVGLTAGLNIANTIDAYDSNFSTDAIAAFNAGLTLEIPIVYPLSFAPEIMYSGKGYAANTQYGRFTQRTNYIDVPLLLKVKLAPNFNFLVGPSINFLTSTSNKYETDFNTDYEHFYNNRGDQTNVSGVIGLSVDVARNVELRARYNIDLTANHPDNDSYLPDYRNQVWQIGLGFKFQ
ncbi:porin family protein [Mucilaginibacter sp.]|jgi:hypothetical protein|uniref:porin family protein n=1 Tax=Mucilaginibacter sp. TaxID=1882438 RepID=UPI0025DADC73|nr:porin family protein [Mucilaginibacter sp.]